MILLAPLCLALGALPAAADPALPPLRYEWNLRLRHEQVDDAAFMNEADADTARLRASVSAALGEHWQVLLEGEAIGGLGNNYNSGANGRVDRPSITDATGGEVNQAWIGWRGKRASATAGRQRIVLDNQRFVGNVGWRQNEQTFDALSVEFRPRDNIALRYYWLDRVHRIAGDEAIDPFARERRLDSHLLNASFKRGTQSWVAYSYLHEDRDVPGASTATHGLRWAGAPASTGVAWGWTAELARQVDYAANPADFSHGYWLVEPSVKLGAITWKLGHEHLGGNGRHALQTPLATLHAFNGWADKFLATPAGGLEDSYLLATGKAGKATWIVAGHDYRGDSGGHYGREWNLSLAAPLVKGWTGLAKVADYRADAYARDTRKLWLQLEFAGNR